MIKIFEKCGCLLMIIIGLFTIIITYLTSVFIGFLLLDILLLIYLFITLHIKKRKKKKWKI